MRILDEDVARVKAATDTVAVVGEVVGLKRVGQRWVGLCPFHAEKSGSFYVNAEEGLYHCFGCQAGGDVIRFVRESQHLDFAEAVQFLAEKAGIELRYEDAAATGEQRRRAALIDAMERAVAWYHERLLSGDDAGPARRYLRERGLTGDVVRKFRIGWAPDDWDVMARALKLPDDVLTSTGLGLINRRNRQQDAFRGRILFPIFDVAGKAVALGGRVMPGGDGPKYKNSPETPIYSKRRVLYGLNWAKADVSTSQEVIVCEGYTDVIGFFQAGVPRAVATCGTALADEHFSVLRRFAPRVVLAYDADAAGQAAAERFYEWEKRYEIDVVVADIPSGLDPGELARRDPDALRDAVVKAKPFLGFRLDRVLRSADVRSPEGRARAAEAALAVIVEHPSELVRDQYVMEVADRCRVPADSLRERLRGGAGRVRVEPVARPAAAHSERGPEVELLRLAVHRPDAVADLVHDVLFADDINLAAFRALCDAETLAGAIERATPEAAALLQRLAVEETDAEPEDVVALVVEARVKRAIGALEAEARASQALVDVAWPKLTVERLRDPVARTEATRQLVAWLVQSSQEGE